MPYILAAVAVALPVLLVVQVRRGRIRVECCAVLPPLDQADVSSSATGTRTQ